MNIENLLTWPGRRSLARAPEADALSEPDALVESALLDVRIDATTSSVWVLFDCRGALQVKRGNTAVVAVNGVTSIHWQAGAPGRRTWRAVMGWQPARSDRGFSCTAELAPGSSLQMTGSSAEFYVGNIPGGDEPPPDFTSASDEQIRAGLASWTSQFTVTHASFT